jgi:hypothetical protein
MLKETLELRYPQLLFLLSTCQASPLSSSHIDASERICNFAQNVKVNRSELILLIGLDDPGYFLSLTEWLKNHPQSHFLVFEEKLEAIAAFLQQPEAQDVLQHPQIHLRYILEHADLIQGLKEAVKEYPAERVWIEVTPSYEKKYCRDELSLTIFRHATIASALFNEDVYYHLLFRNLLSNFNRLHECFYADALKGSFKNIPAIVCGAGPSLSAHIPYLKELGSKALLIGGGSTLAALSSQGVHPHIGLALDPNPEEYDRLKANYDFEVPILFGSRVAASIFRTLNSPLGYMRTFSGGFAEQALEEKMGLDEESFFQGVSQEGLSVTVMCVAVAIRLGCNPIILSGVDLAYTGGKRYADGVVQDASIQLDELHKETKTSERLLLRENRHGDPVYTTVKWIMEAQAIEDFIHLHPEVKVYDSIETGLGFKSCEYRALPELIQQELLQEYDLKGYVHQRISSLPHFREKKEQVALFVQELKASVERSLEIVCTLLKHLERCSLHPNPEESSMLTLYTMDLEEEEAYLYLLEPMQELIVSCLQKEMGMIRNSSSSPQGALMGQKWRHFEKLLKYYQELFSSSL